MKRSVIYIPGLGDSRVLPRQLAVASWRLWGVHSYVFQMNWSDCKAYAPKEARLLRLIDQLAQTSQVSIVGESAGASAAINVYAKRPDTIKALVSICGKINHPGAVQQHYKQRNPAFWESIQLAPDSLASLNAAQRAKILSIRSINDDVVSAADSIVEGAINNVAKTSGHIKTIAIQILFGAPSFLKFIKRYSNQT